LCDSPVDTGILRESFAMKAVTKIVGTLLLCASAVLAGCGGGGYIEGEIVGDVVVVQPPPVTVVQPAAFSMKLRVNGSAIPNVNLLPGLEQDVEIPAGNNFELTASGPVAWTVVAGGRILDAPVGTAILYNGISISPAVINNARYAANTLAIGPSTGPVVVSFILTSLQDRRQEAQINVVLIN
jgi:hypothetical protein